MQIETEVIKFISTQRPQQFKAGLSDLQLQYLTQIESNLTIQDIILGGLKNGWLVNFVQLYNLIKKMVDLKLIQNKNFYDQFNQLQKNMSTVAVQNSLALSKKTNEEYKKEFNEMVNLPFLRSLEKRVALKLLEDADILDFLPEAIICKKGEATSRNLYILLSGEAAIYGQGAQAKKFISLLKPVSVFGEMGFFLGTPRTADIVAVRQSKVLVISGNSEFVAKNLNMEKAESLVHRFWIQQALVNSEVFKNIPADTFDQLTFGGEIVRIATNQKLFSENDLTNGAYIIVQGQVSVLINNKVVAKNAQGQMIGEISLFKTQGKRSATVIADRDTVLMHISLQKFYQLLSQNLFLAQTLQELSEKRYQENSKS
jgi:CRP-like cAMP-binding protein